MASLAPITVSEPLSDLPALDPTTSAPLMNFKLMAQLQDACPSIKKMLTSFHLLCDVSTGTPQPLVPTSLHQNVFSHLYAVSHPGIRASRPLVSSRFDWPGLSTEVHLEDIYLMFIWIWLVLSPIVSHILTMIDRTFRWLDVVLPADDLPALQRRNPGGLWETKHQLLFLLDDNWGDSCWIPEMQYTAYSILHILLVWLLYTTDLLK